MGHQVGRWMTYLTSEQLSISAHQKEILLIIYTGADGPSRLGLLPPWLLPLLKKKYLGTKSFVPYRTDEAFCRPSGNLLPPQPLPSPGQSSRARGHIQLEPLAPSDLVCCKLMVDSLTPRPLPSLRPCVPRRTVVVGSTRFAGFATASTVILLAKPGGRYYFFWSQSWCLFTCSNLGQ